MSVQQTGAHYVHAADCMCCQRAMLVRLLVCVLWGVTTGSKLCIAA
jgi:hypothetical protein